MMIKMNRSQAIDAANVITHIRPDWQQAGIITALQALPADTAYATAVTHAIRVANDPKSHNPRAITAIPIAAVDDDAARQKARADYEQRLEEHRLRLAEAQQCRYCDHNGYLPNGLICTHLDPHRNVAARQQTRRLLNEARKNRAPTPAQP